MYYKGKEINEFYFNIEIAWKRGDNNGYKIWQKIKSRNE
jgi:hypothetical protein